MKQKTFKYGLCKPTLNADLVNQEIDKGFIYQNKLIEIERWKRDQIRLVYGKFDNIPQLELNVSDKETIFNEIKKQIKKENAESRTKIKNKILSDKKNNAHIELMAAEKILKDARSQIDKLPEFKEAKKKINDEANAKIAEIRKSDQAPWRGTYMLVEQAVGLTARMPLYDGITPNNPRFRIRRLHTGRLGIKQFQTHESIDKVVGKNPISLKIQIVPLPPAVKKTGKPYKIGNKDLRLLRLRIGTKDFINDNGKNKKEPI
jgi:hypothetical protein